jgi:Filamin/ABP280 repeat/Calponin homology (CH) domain
MRWSNSHLSDRLLKIEDLETDLQSGVLLINLLEVISNKTIKYNKNPRFKLMMLENLNAALEFVKREGLKLVNIGGEDIFENNLKIILGLIWTIILRYQINKGIAEGSPKWLLLEWVRKQVKPYGIPEPKDFTSSWIDGQTLSALCDSLEPGTFPKDTWTGDAMTDTQSAMTKSLEHYEIPQLMDAEDMVETPDELSTMTYVAQFRDYAEKQAERLAYLRGVPNTGFSYIEGPGLEGGHADVEGTFTIYARNYEDDALTTGGHHFKVGATGPSGADVVVAVADNNDGTYSCAYTPDEAGQYTISAQLSPKPDIAIDSIPEGVEFTHIKNSPANVDIKASVDGAKSTAEGPGLGSPYTDVETEFTITSRDKHGNPVPEGGRTFDVAIAGPSGNLTPAAADNGDGTYTVRYTPTEKGAHTVEVSHEGTPIEGSPFNVAAKPSIVAGQSTAEGAGLEDDENVNTKETGFTVTARDKHGDQVPEGNANVGVEIAGPNGAVGAAITDNGDGTYDVRYTPADAGAHRVTVTIDGEPIKDSPRTVSIKPNVVTSQCTAEGPGVDGPLKVDKRAPFTITARDDTGAPVSDGGYEFVVKVESPHGAVAADAVADNNDGTYSGSWTPTHSGDHTISITDADGNHIAQSPYTHRVDPQPDPNHSYIEGPGLTDAFDNAPAEFTIYLKDKNAESIADGHPQVSIDGPDSDVKKTVTNNGDGSYAVVYEADVPGDYTIGVLTTSDGEGEHCTGSPSTAKVIEGSHDTGHGEFTYTFQAKNKHGENKTYGGDAFTVEIKHRAAKGDTEEADIESEAIDNEDGTYTAKYKLDGEGRFSVSIKLNGKHVKGSPFVNKL